MRGYYGPPKVGGLKFENQKIGIFWPQILEKPKMGPKILFFVNHKPAVIFLMDKSSLDEFWSLFLYLGPKGEEIWPFFHAQFVGV